MSASSLPDPHPTSSQVPKCAAFFRQSQTEALHEALHEPTRRGMGKRALNPEDPLLVTAERTFRIFNCRVREAWNWEGADLVELEAVEEASSDHWDIRVLIRWEAIWGEQGRPSNEALIALARERIVTHFTENRYPPRFSSLYRPVHLEIAFKRGKARRERRKPQCGKNANKKLGERS